MSKTKTISEKKRTQVKNAKKMTYKNQTRDVNGRFGALKVKTKESILKGNYYDFHAAKSKLKNIQSKANFNLNFTWIVSLL